MNLVRLLKEDAGAAVRSILWLALISGIANGVLLAIINSAAANTNSASPNIPQLAMFAIAITLFIYTKRLSLMRSTVMAESVITRFRLRIGDKYRKSELELAEKIDKSVIESRLSQDTLMLSQAAGEIINAVQSAVMVTVCILYLAMLSVSAFVATLLMIAAGVSIYLANQKKLMAELHRSTQKEVEFFNTLNHLVSGFKELKMNRAKSDDLYENTYRDISVSAEALKVKTGGEFIKNYIFSQTFFYVLIGVLVFLLPTMSPTYGDVLTKTTAVILFIIGPLTSMVGTIPIYSKANVAVDNLYQFEHFLDSHLNGGVTVSPLRFEDFKKIELEKVHFAYANSASATGFAVGPFDFEVQRGETVFIVGGNGSGKSTLMKLLVALYRPAAGGITVDGLRLQKQHYAHYRELFSIIFTDFHLFERLYGVQHVDERHVLRLLKEMQLDDKTGFENGRFTNLNLSTGQKKRLALIIAMLDDRPILALDEFAADQDPSFRAYFYETILQELKARGKTVIAITHDDKYFGFADRVVKMEDGKIEPYHQP